MGIATESNKPSRRSLYLPNDDPGLTRFAVKCHPRADEICAELDNFYLENWPFENETERQSFVSSKITRWACLAVPLAADDRIYDLAKLQALFFLLDDAIERKNLTEGKTFYARLIAIARGKILPNRLDAIEWITHDLFTSMRTRDEELTEEVLQGAIMCLSGQVDEARMNCADMSALIRHRVQEGGTEFVAATIRYGMELHLASETLLFITAITNSFAELGIIVNDICSFDKELRDWKTSSQEGAHLLNVVQRMADDTGIPYPAAKRVWWILCRERELHHQDLVAQHMASNPSCDEDLATYILSLEYAMGGNEVWSRTTSRYNQRF